MRPAAFAVLVLSFFLLLAGAGSGQQPAKNKTDPKAKVNSAPTFNMKLTTNDIVLGQHIMGAKIEKSDLKDRVVLIDEWGIHCPPCLAAMPHTAELNAELANFGLLIIGSHRQDGNADEIRAVAISHRANFPISQMTFVRGSEDNKFIPHCILFDHTGKCIFRGQPAEAESHVRKAVGAALVAAAGREKFSPPLAQVVKDLKAGKPPLTILPRVAAMRNYSGDAGTDAKALLAAMTAGGRKKLEEAAEKKGSDPVEAFTLIEKLPTAYKGSPLAHEANEMLNKLKGEKAVRAELAARQYVEKVHVLDQQLGLGAEDPRKPQWQKAHSPILKQLKDKVGQMKRAWPDARATKEALEIAERYGIDVK